MARDDRGRWVKGTSGNPEGRPPNTGLKDAVLALLESEDDEGISNLSAIAATVVGLAKGGDMRAVEFLGKRCWPERLAIEEGEPSERAINIADRLRAIRSGLHAERIAQAAQERSQ